MKSCHIDKRFSLAELDAAYIDPMPDAVRRLRGQLRALLLHEGYPEAAGEWRLSLSWLPYDKES